MEATLSLCYQIEISKFNVSRKQSFSFSGIRGNDLHWWSSLTKPGNNSERVVEVRIHGWPDE